MHHGTDFNLSTLLTVQSVLLSSNMVLSIHQCFGTSISSFKLEDTIPTNSHREARACWKSSPVSRFSDKNCIPHPLRCNDSSLHFCLWGRKISSFFCNWAFDLHSAVHTKHNTIEQLQRGLFLKRRIRQTPGNKTGIRTKENHPRTHPCVSHENQYLHKAAPKSLLSFGFRGQNLPTLWGKKTQRGSLIFQHAHPFFCSQIDNFAHLCVFVILFLYSSCLINCWLLRPEFNHILLQSK